MLYKLLYAINNNTALITNTNIHVSSSVSCLRHVSLLALFLLVNHPNISKISFKSPPANTGILTLKSAASSPLHAVFSDIVRLFLRLMLHCGDMNVLPDITIC